MQLGIVSNSLEKRYVREMEIKEKIEIIQTSVLLKSARILWNVMGTQEDLLSFGLE